MLRVTLIVLACAIPALPAAPDFKRDIAPIVQRSCAQCHVGNVVMGKLSLANEADLLRGGASGPAIVPGHSGDSLLIKRLLGYNDMARMPVGAAPLSSEQVALIRSWIDNADFSVVKASALAVAAVASSSAPDSSVYASQVRPVLARRCYSCHGPDVQQNGLRLDSLAGILKGSDSGKVVVPGKSQDSRLVRRLQAQERPMMPYGGPPLSSTELAVIQKWINDGAPGPDSNAPLALVKTPKHWAYVKPVQSPLPAVHDAAWIKNPIDNFVLAKLEAEGLKPSPEASKTAVLRRVYLDLTGLPPSIKELDDYLADRSPDAYEKVVDRLLASPHYGERWARPWLDLARYADSNGYEKDRIRTAWEYRDWVIRALNSGMSFRDFTIQQIAGDMLPNPTKDQLIATGFNRNSMLNQEGGIDIDEYYWYSLVDRVNTTASVFLGSTLGCAQCHNHKFDPFLQKDYYRFLAFFNNVEHKGVGVGDRWVDEPEIELPTPDQAKRSAEIKASIGKLEDVLHTQTAELNAAQQAWEAQMKAAESQWHLLTITSAKSEGGATLTQQASGSILASGANPQADTYTLDASNEVAGASAIRLEVLPDASLPHNGPGRDPEGNFFLSDFEVRAGADRHLVVWKAAEADESQDGYGIGGVVKKGSGLSGWAIEARPDSAGLRRQAVFIANEALPAGPLTITMKHMMRRSSRNIGCFRLSVTSSADPKFIVQIPARDRPLLGLLADKAKLSADYREVAPSLDPVRKHVASLQQDLKKLGIATAMVMGEKPTFLRPAAYIRERGTFTSPGELVYADVPSALGTLPKDAMPNRLGLAQWLVSDDNPLTARVAVNHFWETIFGHGIVETSEDFGTQGDPPSHPELLDWLATEFMHDGWDMKKIQRLMVTSATYRQDSRVSPALLERDPYNKLYARGPRFRVEAETVHDLALSISGLLSDKMYGPGVFPYQPEGVWNIPYSSDKWVQSEGEDQHRRAVYTFIRRSAPYPSLVTYDAPSREFCTVRRVRTNTPLQALTSLNDPFFFNAAHALAQRMSREGGSSLNSRIAYGYRLTVSRVPSAAELEKVSAFYTEQLAAYRQKPNKQDPPELSALTMVANVLLSMDETITKE
jgi:mono/diheme cytochrome c family protein